MEQPSDQWDLVIKVKYGDTLRRIGAYVHGQLMDHNMSKLRAKIISLFKFSHDDDLMLTYTDEDGDVITLVDDHDLRDAVIGQHLNPFRINVQLNPISYNSKARSEISSPAMSHQPETLPTNDEPLNSVSILTSLALQLFHNAEKVGSPSPLDEIMKSELFRSAIGIISKDVQSASVLAPIMEWFSKLELSKDNQTSGPTGESSIISHEASSHVMDLNVADEVKISLNRIVEGTKLPSNTAGSINPSPEQNEYCNMVHGGSDICHTTLSSLDLNVDAQTSSSYPCDNLLTSTLPTLKHLECEKEVGGSHVDGIFFSPSAIVIPPDNPPRNSESLPTYMPALPNIMYGYTDIMHGHSNDKQSPKNTLAPSPVKTGINSHFEVPISKQVGASPSEILQPIIPITHTYQQSYIYDENTQKTCHRVLQCDGCGMHPITGARFKSTVMEDYDLCNSCFAKIGNESDYMRIDYAPYHTSGLLKEFDNHHSRHQFPLSNALHDFGARPPKTKLNSRLIQDVAILEGTMMPPSTHFTKIWRMHNNGTVAWPIGTQLVWVGGDQFGNQVLTDLEIPPSGFPVDDELDIAVDLTTPSRSGRYVSYWRMASPTGQKFGQQVWVLIEVDCSQLNFADPAASAADVSSFQSNLNLNLPPESNDCNVSGIIDINAEPLDNGFTKTHATGTNMENSPSAPVSDFVDLYLGNDDVSKHLPTGVDPHSAPYPLIDLPATSSLADTFPGVATAASDDNVVEEALLKELEAMGFSQNDLNKEILRRNEYDLEQSVDDLCDYAEWGPILSELHEMSMPPAENIKYATTTVTKWRRIKRVSW